jgi:nucleotide-binding universal stress UspA family protein
MLGARAMRSDGLRVVRPALAVLCAVEPALATFEAVRHAAPLARGGSLTLVDPELPADRSAETHLIAARFIAARAGAPAAELGLVGDDPVAELLAAAEAYDVLVVVDRRDDGSPGRLADVAVRRAAGSVLVSRRLPHGRVLDDAIALMAGDSDAARAARALGRRLAGRPGANVAVLPAPDGAAGADGLLRAARRADATLLVMPDASPEVAARVARRAPCAVLVARPAVRAGAPPSERAAVAAILG